MLVPVNRVDLEDTGFDFLENEYVVKLNGQPVVGWVYADTASRTIAVMPVADDTLHGDNPIPQYKWLHGDVEIYRAARKF